MLSFFRISPSEKDWAEIESCFDSTVFHSQAWSNYLSRTVFKPFIVKIIDSGKTLGYFIGVRFGFIFHNVAAPMEGTGTYTQGLCFLHPVSIEKRLSVYQELRNWIFVNKIASLMQFDDWNLRQELSSWVDPKSVNFPTISEFIGGGATLTCRPTLYVDLHKEEDELWSGLSYKSCKYCINKARKEGLRVNIIDQYDDIPRFTKNHYKQLVDVCNRHGTRPKASQKRARMQSVCESLFPDRVLMIEVIGRDDQEKEQIMSSAIFCYDKGESTYFTGASEQKYMKYCPNELMVWQAMRILHKRGAGALNFGGMAPYKLKFGTTYAYVPRIYLFKHPFFYATKQFLFKAYHSIRNFLTKR